MPAAVQSPHCRREKAAATTTIDERLLFVFFFDWHFASGKKIVPKDWLWLGKGKTAGIEGRKEDGLGWKKKKKRMETENIYDDDDDDEAEGTTTILNGAKEGSRQANSAGCIPSGCGFKPTAASNGSFG